MGLFDLFTPVLVEVDSAVGPLLPDLLWLVVWGLVSSAICMGLYWLTSSQAKMEALKAQIAEVRSQINAYDGPFEGVQPLLWRSICLSLRQCALSLGPAVLGSLPVLFLLPYLAITYGYRLPTAGEELPYAVVPAGADVHWSPAIATYSAEAAVAYPRPEAPLTLEDRASLGLVTLPLSSAMPEVSKWAWWNALFGNPAGYLPADSPVDKVEWHLPRQNFLAAYLPAGVPAWLGYWETIYFAVLILGSLIIKFACGIH